LPVNPNGSKYFRLKYRFDKKELMLALGVYPETSLKEARTKRDTARNQIADGISPSENIKAVKTARSTNLAGRSSSRGSQSQSDHKGRSL